MAITKLMHMKEAPECSYAHLKNAINYVLDVKHNQKKTAGGTLVGGNSGLDNVEILENFLETKREYGKEDGRQGYHFVISFEKGETDATTAYEVVREFCEQYLGDSYDYVFAVHNDKEHIHGHIIFNSVDRINGYKYHYKKGDWEKCIQPVTDKICEEHHLSSLVFVDERVGVSYASWAEKQGDIQNWTHIISADVDYAIQKSSSMDEFLSLMEKMNYRLRTGYSKENGDYITFRFVDSNGKEHRRRSYNMPSKKNPSGYGPKEILQRIQTKEGSRTYEEVMERLSKKAAGYINPVMMKDNRTYTRLFQAVSYYKLPNPFAVPAYRVRKDMLHIDRLLEECQYLKTNHLKGTKELERRMVLITNKLERLLTERKKLYGIQNEMNLEQREYMKQYEELQKKIMAFGNATSGFEELEDNMAAVEKMFPRNMLETRSRIEELSEEISSLRKEKRILNRIWKTEGEAVNEIRTDDIVHRK